MLILLTPSLFGKGGLSFRIGFNYSFDDKESYPVTLVEVRVVSIDIANKPV